VPSTPASRSASRSLVAAVKGGAQSPVPCDWNTGSPGRAFIRSSTAASSVLAAPESSAIPANGHGSRRTVSSASTAPCENPPITRR
jgi:hypothetical protein